VRPSSGAEIETSADLSPDASSEWKREANHRLAAHRARRSGRAVQQAALPGMETMENQERIEGNDGAERDSQPHSQQKIKSVADRVAARYAHAPTYSEILAAEARNAARAAETAAVAAGEARDAAQAILVGLDVERQEQFARQEHLNSGHREPSLATASLIQAERQSRPQESATRHHPAIVEAGDDPKQRVEEEIASPVLPLPAKLLEFPRELIAARKARPRLAEGPLREEYDRSAERSQLRIFEVEHENISTEPVVEPVLPGWSSIRLGSSPEVHHQEYQESHSPAPQPKVTARPSERTPSRNSSTSFDLPLQTASLEDRIMAAVVDAALVAAGFLVFLLVFVACTTHPPTGRPAEIAAGVAFVAFAVMYLLLFFNFGQDTPGMRYAKIALCTFDDENPSRRAMRRRLGALLLSLSPLGLGILWAFFDDDRLSWHDRISRTYQRSYR
jgi:uncharacterized RDD family membrane protein YckC